MQELSGNNKDPTPEERGTDLPLEGAFRYARFKMTKVSEVS